MTAFGTATTVLLLRFAMEAKLAAYRANKRKVEEETERRQLWWNLLTFQLVRQRLANLVIPERITAAQSSEQAENEQEENYEEEEEEPAEWTNLDWAILTVKFLIWLCLLGLCVQQEVASLYLVVTGFALIYLNLGTGSNRGRAGGRVSAYSVFNENCQAIDGSLKAEHFERDLLFKKKD